MEDGPGLCPGASGDRSRPLPALASAPALASPTPGTGSTAFCASPAVPRALGASLSSPLTLSFQTGLSSCPPQGGKPPAPPQQTPQENQSPNTRVAAGRLYSWVEGKNRSQKWVTVVPWTAGGISSAQASPAISGCFCRRCLSRVARRPKGTQQWGHSKRGPPGPRPCMRRWRLSLLLWAQA